MSYSHDEKTETIEVDPEIAKDVFDFIKYKRRAKIIADKKSGKRIREEPEGIENRQKRELSNINDKQNSTELGGLLIEKERVHQEINRLTTELKKCLKCQSLVRSRAGLYDEKHKLQNMISMLLNPSESDSISSSKSQLSKYQPSTSKRS
ncbi:uncharacterized protein LOC122510529 isoform X2 [Leptopilina heterotoma]|uniref:uncharacterized protein LOC122510529 isoform X2 n=1 Tax=Leptopilina heterotoma TaxID=63436 RepID=UPI001CAA0B93|nr:uncharacterized protein LOC122510529 isoform X2 [Leptopilina heterotoma]